MAPLREPKEDLRVQFWGTAFKRGKGCQGGQEGGRGSLTSDIHSALCGDTQSPTSGNPRDQTPDCLQLYHPLYPAFPILPSSGGDPISSFRDTQTSDPSPLFLWNTATTLNSTLKFKFLSAHACNLSLLGDWGRKIAMSSRPTYAIYAVSGQLELQVDSLSQKIKKKLKIKLKRLSVVVNTCYPSAREAEVGKLLQVRGKPGLHKTLSPKPNK